MAKAPAPTKLFNLVYYRSKNNFDVLEYNKPKPVLLARKKFLCANSGYTASRFKLEPQTKPTTVKFNWK